MKVYKKLSMWLASFALSAYCVSSANAAFVMTLDDINDSSAPIVIYDGSGSDQNGVNGVISYSGSVGVFSVNVTTGVSKPVVGPARLDLNSIDVSGAAGTLLVAISDTDYSGNYGGFAGSFGGTTDGAVDFSFMYDQGNAQFGGNEFASGGYIGSSANDPFSGTDYGLVDSSSLFSLSILAEIDHGQGFNVSSFNAGIVPVPLPAGIFLFASAIISLLVRARGVIR